jgi:hypothetical protein
MNLQPNFISNRENPHDNLFLPGPLPVMVPPSRSRGLSLHASILNREHISEDTLLVHRHTEQLAAITSAGAKLFTCVLHTLVLAHPLGLVLAALLSLEQLPGTVDGPVTEVTVTGEAERARGERVVKEVTNESYGIENVSFFLFEIVCGWWLYGIEARNSKSKLKPWVRCG